MFCKKVLVSLNAVVSVVAVAISLLAATGQGHPYSAVSAEKFWVPDGPVYATARTTDSVYIGGDFNYVGRNTGYGIAFPHADSPPTSSTTVCSSGTLCNLPDFIYSRINGPIYAAVSDGHGGFFLGGDFTFATWELGGIAAKNIVHIKGNRCANARGHFYANGPVRALAFDGTFLYAGGDFTEINFYDPSGTYDVNPHSCHHLARISVNFDNGNLVLNTTWSPDTGDNRVNALALNGTDIGVGSDSAFTVFDTASTATVFAKSTDAPVYAVAVGTDGDWYIGGAFTTVGTTTGFTCGAGMDTSGNLNSYVPYVLGGAIRVLLPTSSGIWVGGDFTEITGEGCHLGLTNSIGSISLYDLVDVSGPVYSLALSGSTLYVGGDFPDDSNGRNLTAFDISSPPHTRITDWMPNVNGPVDALALSTDPDEIVGTTLYAGGEFTATDTHAASNLARLSTSDGSLDTSWLPDPNAPVRAVALDDVTSSVYVGGDFTSIAGESRSRLAKFSLSDSTLDSWNGQILDTELPNPQVRCLALDGDFLYVGGNFFPCTDDSNPAIFHAQPVRFSKSSGYIDRTWRFQPEEYRPAYMGVNCILPDPNSDAIYLGGEFDQGLGGGSGSVNPEPVNLAKIYKSTAQCYSWHPDPTNGLSTTSINALALKDGTLYVGGQFSEIAGGNLNALAALDASDASLLTFDAQVTTDSIINAIAPESLDDNESLYLGGKFTIADTTSYVNYTTVSFERQNLCAVDGVDGSLLNWNPVCSPDAEIYSVGANPVAAAGVGKYAVDVGGGLGSVGINPFSGYSTFLPLSFTDDFVYGGDGWKTGTQDINRLSADIEWSPDQGGIVKAKFNPTENRELIGDVIEWWRNYDFVPPNPDTAAVRIMRHKFYIKPVDYRDTFGLEQPIPNLAFDSNANQSHGDYLSYRFEEALQFPNEFYRNYFLRQVAYDIIFKTGVQGTPFVLYHEQFQVPEICQTDNPNPSGVNFAGPEFRSVVDETHGEIDLSKVTTEEVEIDAGTLIYSIGGMDMQGTESSYNPIIYTPYLEHDPVDFNTSFTCQTVSGPNYNPADDSVGFTTTPNCGLAGDCGGTGGESRVGPCGTMALDTSHPLNLYDIAEISYRLAGIPADPQSTSTYCDNNYAITINNRKYVDMLKVKQAGKMISVKWYWDSSSTEADKLPAIWMWCRCLDMSAQPFPQPLFDQTLFGGLFQHFTTAGQLRSGDDLRREYRLAGHFMPGVYDPGDYSSPECDSYGPEYDASHPTQRVYTSYLEPPIVIPDYPAYTWDPKYAYSQEMKALKLEFWLMDSFHRDVNLYGNVRLKKVEVYLHDIP
jgi:hypothetical protein